MKAARLLDICIPSYNRSKELIQLLRFFDMELGWLEKKLLGYVRIIISDNASDDGTEEKLKRLFQDDIVHKENFEFFRNSFNVGIVANAYKVIGYSCSRYIWVMGDDDILEEGILHKVLRNCIKYNPNFIFLNHDVLTRKKRSDMVCSNINGGYYDNSFQIVKKQLHLNTDALGFTSAVIFKRFILKRIISTLPLDGELDYGWSYLAGIYASVLGHGYFEQNIYLHKQSYGCSWDNVFYEAVYGSFCSLKKLGSLGCDKSIIKEVQKSYITETDILYDIIEKILIDDSNSKICKKFLIKLLQCDMFAVIKKIRDK